MRSTLMHPLRLLMGTILTLLLMTGAVAAPAAPAPAAASKKVAFLPFESHAAKDLSYLTSGIRDMLASRLAAGAQIRVIDRASVDKALAGAKPVQPEQFRALGRGVGADYVVAGSLTTIGSSMSLDARVFNVTSDEPAQTFFATAASENVIISAIDQLAWEMGAKVFGAQRPGAGAAAAPAAAPAAQQQYLSAHPERAFMGQGGQGGGRTPFIYSRGINSVFDFTKSPNMSMALQYMELVDLNGDGAAEVVLADLDGVHIYKRDGSRFSKVGRIAGPSGYRIHAITVADLNNNGKPEVYVSAANHQAPRSMAFEWTEGNTANYLFKDAAWYVRVMELPGEGTVLAGQRADFDKPLAPGIFRLELQGSGLKAGSRIDLPAKVNLFEFTIADLDNDGTQEIIAIDQDDRLRVMRPSGSLLWQGDEYYGGTTRFIGGVPPAKDQFDATGHHEYDRIYIPSRLIVFDVNNDGIKDIIVNKNLSSSSRLFKNMKNYPSGEIHALTWNGIALTELWRTRKIDGYIVDYLLRPNAEKTGAELLVGVILSANILDLSTPTSTVLMYQLDLTKKIEQ